MENLSPYIFQHTQHHTLPIRLVAPNFGQLPLAVIKQYSLTHRKTHYFFIFMIDGTTRHSVDLQHYDVASGELLFILPHQIHQLPPSKQGTDYYKLAFDESCLSRLPKQYPFLINPFNQQKIHFTGNAAQRLQHIFGMLAELLSTADADTELILAHLNSLLTEINTAYFLSRENLVEDKLSKYIGFKQFVEEQLREHPTINDIAAKLALNTNSLYYIVKHYSGLSPKEFITNRLILEAKRRLYYSESSVKELAFDLGYNDPEYFSRLFKKVTGKTVSGFVQDLSGK
ncbi:AraC family transcriptional regulator [Chitinophaga caeni]|uniref:AraC family transcriptional regulator n=1 Tax=Chitinophaga caeni TaxID=2029983 RepID=A0A291QVV4_9BACT|nr:AraC family transcriptional regulator [Chitinophaga caeni]ATL48065.1 AraC family transcriptional regulator [Chitinophaga caeni]